MTMLTTDFEALATRLRPALRKTALGLTRDEAHADDIAQDTLLRLWQMRDRLDGYRSVEALARVIARNLSLDFLRGRHTTVSLDDLAARGEPEGSDAESPHALLAAAELEREVDEVLSRLAPAQQAVMRMRHTEGLEIEEIARLIGSSPANVRVLLCRARARVKTLFNPGK